MLELDIPAQADVYEKKYRPTLPSGESWQIFLKRYCLATVRARVGRQMKSYLLQSGEQDLPRLKVFYWVFAPSSESFCAPVLLNALSDAAFLAGSTA